MSKNQNDAEVANASHAPKGNNLANASQDKLYKVFNEILETEISYNSSLRSLNDKKEYITLYIKDYPKVLKVGIVGTLKTQLKNKSPNLTEIEMTELLKTEQYEQEIQKRLKAKMESNDEKFLFKAKLDSLGAAFDNKNKYLGYVYQTHAGNTQTVNHYINRAVR